MSDQGFDFKPIPPTRHTKRFEPPPWERTQFEEVQRRREAEATTHEETTDSVLTDPGKAAGERETAGDQHGAAVDDASRMPQTEGRDNPTKEATVDEKQLALMLAGLRNEEPAAVESFWRVAVSAAAVVTAVGALLTIWGVFALVSMKRLGSTGVFAGLVLLIFGLGFIAVGAWLAFRTLRQRGVL